MNSLKKFLVSVCVTCTIIALCPLSVSAVEETEKPQVELFIPQTMKVGDSLKEISSNPGNVDLITIGKMSNFPKETAVILCTSEDGYRMHLGDPTDVVNGEAYIQTDLFRVYEPGKKKLEVRQYSPSGEKNGSTLIEYTVEEPVITDNAPRTVQSGQSINFSTNLTNTSLVNTKVEPYLNPDNYYMYKEEILGGIGYDDHENAVYSCHDIAYLPKVEIIEGKELVAQSNQDYSNILNSSETLTFNGSGVVKLKITYQQIMTCGTCEAKWNEDETELLEDYRYNPTKTIEIQVVDQTIQIADEQSGVKLEADKDVLPNEATLKVTKVDSGSDFENVKNLLGDKTNQFAAYDISIMKDNQKIQPNGSVMVQMPIPSTYDVNNLRLYHIFDDGKMDEVPFTVNEEEQVIEFNTNSFSIYVLAELKTEEDNEQVETPSTGSEETDTTDQTDQNKPSEDNQVENDKVTSSSPQTGDINISMWALMMTMSFFCGAVLLIRRKLN